MLFGILKNAPVTGEVSAVFHQRTEDFVEPLEGDPMSVPRECLFLLNPDFHACLPPAVFATDIVFTAGAMLHWGSREYERGTLSDHRVIGLIARDVGPVTLACIIALEKHGLMRPFGAVKNVKDVFNALGQLRLAGRNHRAELQEVAA